jgi:hypothetical protein
VARVVQGIISYTYWPSQPHILQFCIVGATRYRPQLLSDLRGTPGRPLQPRLIQRAYAPLMRGCDILYFSADTPATRQALQGIDRAALTISERDPACRGGAMFCLRIGAGALSFDLNLDAVTRSGLRVDPKVLMLGRAGATPRAPSRSGASSGAGVVRPACARCSTARICASRSSQPRWRA